MTFEKYITPAEERQLFAHLKRQAALDAQRDLHWITFMRYTGIRVKAMSLFTCGDARAALASGELLLRAEIQKRGRPHRMHLKSEAREALIALLKIRKAMGAMEEPDAPLVISRRGAGMTVRNYQDRLRHHARAAGLTIAERISPHWLRHTLAKRLIARSTAADPRAIVQGVLGHSSYATTSIYTAPDRETIAHELEAYG